MGTCEDAPVQAPHTPPANSHLCPLLGLRGTSPGRWSLRREHSLEKRSTQTPEETCIHLESDLDERAQALGRHTLLPLWLPLCPSLRCRIAFFSRSSLSSSSHQHEERDYRGESPVFQSFNLEVMHIFSANIPLAKT